jgi:hypothetical protein
VYICMHLLQCLVSCLAGENGTETALLKRKREGAACSDSSQRSNFLISILKLFQYSSIQQMQAHLRSSNNKKNRCLPREVYSLISTSHTTLKASSPLHPSRFL